MKLGELRELIKDLPDDTEIVKYTSNFNITKTRAKIMEVTEQRNVLVETKFAKQPITNKFNVLWIE